MYHKIIWTETSKKEIHVKTINFPFCIFYQFINFPPTVNGESTYTDGYSEKKIFIDPGMRRGVARFPVVSKLKHAIFAHLIVIQFVCTTYTVDGSF